MLRKIAILAIGVAVLMIAGCRTGEYKADLEIYERMPSILAADPELQGKLMLNDDGTPKVEFEKGEMFLYLALGLDEGTRKEAVSRAFELFHQQYMESETNRRKDGTFYRKVIHIRGFVEDTELYVIEWDLSEENPNLISDRYGYFI